MKEKILKLKEEGKSYKQITDLLGCSKGTVSYYLGDNQRNKTNVRTRKRRENVVTRKFEAFKYRKPRYMRENVRKFNKRDPNSKYDNTIVATFTADDVIKKFGVDTVCYLSGEKINLYENTYNFDHINAVCRGGNNSLDNLGILHSVVNKMKDSLTPEELIEWCVKILKYNGYDVNKIKND